MVRLTSITTKSGDRGQTGLGDGTRVPKSHPRIEAMGTVDELNAVMGMVLAGGVPDSYTEWLRQIQNDLFDLGADLCFPLPENGVPVSQLLTPKHVSRLDDWLEKLQPLLSPLESFILPGGSLLPASLHWTRTVCRRAERTLFLLAEQEAVPDIAGIYLNRLSDLLFQLARITENPSDPAPLWQPGRSCDT